MFEVRHAQFVETFEQCKLWLSRKKTARVQQSSAQPECSLWLGEVRIVVVLVWVLYSV